MGRHYPFDRHPDIDGRRLAGCARDGRRQYRRDPKARIASICSEAHFAIGRAAKRIARANLLSMRSHVIGDKAEQAL
jgi:hypothetical protein